MDGEVIDRKKKVSWAKVHGYANLNLCKGRLTVLAPKEDWTFFTSTVVYFELVWKALHCFQTWGNLSSVMWSKSDSRINIQPPQYVFIIHIPLSQYAHAQSACSSLLPFPKCTCTTVHTQQLQQEVNFPLIAELNMHQKCILQLP